MSPKKTSDVVPGEKKRINIIQKESALTTLFASGRLTANQKKAFNALLFIAKDILRRQNGEMAEDGFEVPISYLKSVLGDTSNNHLYIKETVKSLNRFEVEANILGKDKDKGRWDLFSLVAGATIEEETKSVRFSFPHQINNALKNPKIYVTLDLDDINRIDRKYAISLFEIIEDYKKLKELPKWTLTQFKRSLDIPEDSYATFRDLHIRVIIPAVREINDKFDMGLEYILYNNLYPVHSKDLIITKNTAKPKNKRMPKITHIQFVLPRKHREEWINYKAFVEQKRKEFRPIPDEGYYPVIYEEDGKEFKVDMTGRLYYIRDEDEETVFLSPDESEKYWKMLWKIEINNSKENDEENEEEDES